MTQRANRQQIEARMCMFVERGYFREGKLTESNLWGCNSMLNTSIFTHTTMHIMNDSNDSSALTQPQDQDMQMCSISSADQKRLFVKAPLPHKFTSKSPNCSILKVLHSFLSFYNPSCTNLRQSPILYSRTLDRFSSQKHQLRFCFQRITGKEQAIPSSSQFFSCTMSRSKLSIQYIRIAPFLFLVNRLAQLRRKMVKATALKYFFSLRLIQFIFFIGLLQPRLKSVASREYLELLWWDCQGCWGCWKAKGLKKGYGLGCEWRCCCRIISKSCSLCLTSSLSSRSNLSSFLSARGVFTFKSRISSLSDPSQLNTADIFLLVPLPATLSESSNSDSVSVCAFLFLLSCSSRSSRSIVAISCLSLLWIICLSRYIYSLSRLSGQ